MRTNVVECLRHGHLLGGIQLLGSSTLPTTRSGRGQSRSGSFPDQFPFKLGQSPEDVEDELAARGRGVDLLREALEADLFLVNRA